LQIKDLFSLVGAGRFERPTPCAQGRFRGPTKSACFQLLLFQTDAAKPAEADGSLLNPEAPTSYKIDYINVG
jgi:hypothetical protein